MNRSTFVKASLSSLIISLFFVAGVLADPPGPPGPGGDPGGGGGVPVGSPIDNTTLILLTLAFVYGVYKIYKVYSGRSLDPHYKQHRQSN